MKYATRINSFMRTNDNIHSAVSEISKVDGIGYVDFNYPEHFRKTSMKDIQETLNVTGLKINAINLRFRDEFINGEFGNHDESIAKKAVNLCKEAIDICRNLNGKQVIIWLGFDGFDYSFQAQYMQTWSRIVKAFQEICDYDSQIKISIEYKPYEERVHSIIDSFGTTMMMLADVNRENLGVTLDFCHMLMKRENPSFAIDYLLNKGKLFNIHLNDGEGVTDDGLMVGSINLWKTVEAIYYLKKHKYEGVIYFDTFPIREEPVKETERNVQMCSMIERMIERLGIKEIENVVKKNDATEVMKMYFQMINL